MGVELVKQLCLLQIVPALKEIALVTVIVKHASSITKKKTNGLFAQGRTLMAAHSKKEALRKREKIQRHFWDQVGAVEHISLPMLEDTIRKEFNRKDDRFVEAQVSLMQTEARIRVETRVKVWIRQPNIEFET